MAPPSSYFHSSTDKPAYNLERSTQIAYQKDAGYTLTKLNVTLGRRIVEAGTGSEGPTWVFAREDRLTPHPGYLFL